MRMRRDHYRSQRKGIPIRNCHEYGSALNGELMSFDIPVTNTTGGGIRHRGKHTRLTGSASLYSRVSPIVLIE